MTCSCENDKQNGENKISGGFMIPTDIRNLAMPFGLSIMVYIYEFINKKAKQKLDTSKDTTSENVVVYDIHGPQNGTKRSKKSI